MSDVRKSYEILEKIGKGTYGKVYKAKCKRKGSVVALKKIKFDKDEDGIPAAVIREVSILYEMQHPHIVKLLDQVIFDTKLFLVFEYSGVDLEKWMEQNKLSQSIIKDFMHQLLSALSHCHMHRIVHRDLKPQNLLVDPSGCLKIADFGMARYFGFLHRNYTPEVVTLWYRPPEIILGLPCSVAADIWSCGCIFAELLMGKPLFTGESETDQLRKIFSVLGSPTEVTAPSLMQAPGLSKFVFEHYPRVSLQVLLKTQDTNAVQLVESMLQYEPSKRISAYHALEHAYFSK